MPRRKRFDAGFSRPPWIPAPTMPVSGGWTESQSDRFVIQAAVGHYENFPVAVSLFGRQAVRALSSVYAFARTADDFADEPAFEGRRLEYLDRWRKQLEDCFEGRASHPVFIALRKAKHDFDLEIEPFLALLSAFEQDARGFHYERYEQVLDYCTRSANPVGRIVLRILGLDSSSGLIRASDRLCTALQLTNFWQDLSVDLPRGRVYVPDDVLSKHSVNMDDLLNRRNKPGMETMLAELVDRARGLYAGSKCLMHETPFAPALFLSMVWHGGTTILERVAGLGTRVLWQRPVLSKRTRARIVLEAMTNMAMGFVQWSR